MLWIFFVHVGIEGLSVETIPENKSDEESENRILQQELNSPADEKVKWNKIQKW